MQTLGKILTLLSYDVSLLTTTGQQSYRDRAVDKTMSQRPLQTGGDDGVSDVSEGVFGCLRTLLIILLRLNEDSSFPCDSVSFPFRQLLFHLPM